MWIRAAAAAWNLLMENDFFVSIRVRLRGTPRPNELHIFSTPLHYLSKLSNISEWEKMFIKFFRLCAVEFMGEMRCETILSIAETTDRCV